MSTTTEFNELKELIEAMDDQEIILPNMPVDEFNQEAEDLYQLALRDKEKLVARGLKEESIDLLNKATGACRYSQSLWNKERNEQQESERIWKEESPAVFDLRDDLIDEFEFAFVNSPHLHSALNRIKDGSGNADMIQDLMDLAVLGRQNPEPLQSINFDMSLLDEAENKAGEMADILAKANGAKDDDNEAKVLRDKAYTYLKKIVDEIRRYGKFVFRKDPDHAAKYASAYHRDH